MSLREKILKALYGGALISSTLAACSGDTTANNEGPEGWNLGENNTTTQTSNNGTSAHNETTVNNPTSANSQTTVNNPTSANNQTSANNTTPPPPVCDPEDVVADLPYDGWREDAWNFPNEPQRYVVCAQPDQVDTCDPAQDLSDAQAQTFARGVLGDGCSSPEPNSVSAVCGPLADRPDECCYVVEMSFLFCAVGRPFTVDGIARLAEVTEREGWCDPLELDISAVPEHLRDEIAFAWAEAGTHEHASVASFSRFLMDLMALGAPRALTEATTKAIADEIRHAHACFSIASAFAGRSLGPDTVDISGSMEEAGDEAHILKSAILEGCIGETLAAAQAEWLVTRAAHPEVRDALRGICDDEGDHAVLAWGFVAWMLRTRPHLIEVARQTLRQAYETEVSQFGLGLNEEQRVLAAHGCVRHGTEDHLRRRAFHTIVVPSAEALFDAIGVEEPVWTQAQRPRA